VLHTHIIICIFKQSVASISLDEDDTPFDSIKGFCDGDFGSGKVKNIRLPTGCWVMAYSERATVLAAGLNERLDFFETQNYSVIYSLPRSDKVSAIRWFRASALSKTTTSVKDCVYNRQDEDEEIMAVAGLDGQVSVYSVSIPLLELQGVRLEHEFQVHSQVRCMALEDFGEGSLLLAIGDKLGKVTLSTLRRDEEGRVAETHRTTLDLGKDPVLGLGIRVERSILLATTKGGKVIVYGLNGIGSRGVEFGEVIWTTQRNGPVRAAIISKDGKQLAFGGYDKSVVLVDTDLWAIVRVLSLEGTVSNLGGLFYP
jgi:WD40 repeat protein